MDCPPTAKLRRAKTLRHGNLASDDAEPSPLEQVVLRMLASEVKLKRNHFIIPRSNPMTLVELHAIFLRLQSKGNGMSKDPATPSTDETVPLPSFQRAFERLFFLLQDPGQFQGDAYDQTGDGHVMWAEFYRVHMQRSIVLRLSLAERLNLIFNQPETCTLAQIISAVILGTIMISSAAFILSTIPECHIHPESCETLATIEKCCLFIFIVEYVVRVATVSVTRMEVHDKAKLLELVAGDEPIRVPSPAMRLLRFLCAPANIVDLAAILPGAVGLLVEADGGAFVVLRLVRLTRIFRAFKSPALVAPVVVIGRTMTQSSKVLYQLAFNLCLGIMIFGALMYTAEGGEDLRTFGVGGRWSDDRQVFERKISRKWTGDTWQPTWRESPFQSIPGAFWWAITTATTVGFGDDVPTTPLGKFVALMLMVFSMVILALPVGVMGETFSKEWIRFQFEKSDKARAAEQAMSSITSAIKDLDPVNLAPLVLIEVWHNHPSLNMDGDRPPMSTFMGQAKLQVRLSPHQCEEAEVSLNLRSCPDLVKRSVSGHIRVAYRWVPRHRRPSQLPTYTSEICARDFDIQGTLHLEILSGGGLININYGGGKSNPFCTVLCHPEYTTAAEGPVPRVWRTCSCHDTLNPEWHDRHSFAFDWSSSTAALTTTEATPTLPSDLLANANKAFGDKLSSTDSQGPALDEVVQVISGLTGEMRQRRADMLHLRDKVRAVSGRVDRLERLGPLTPTAGGTFADGLYPVEGDVTCNDWT